MEDGGVKQQQQQQQKYCSQFSTYQWLVFPFKGFNNQMLMKFKHTANGFQLELCPITHPLKGQGYGGFH